MTEKPIAIVTGVGPGTGSAIVRRFAAGGFRVIALARSPDRIQALEGELPDTHAMICDVSSESQVADAVANVRKSYGTPSVLIHNAVGGGWGTFLEIEPQMLERNFRVNVMGLLYLARELAPDMIKAGQGTILVTGNTSAIRGKANFAGFAPTKAAQRILSESIARDGGAGSEFILATDIRFASRERAVLGQFEVGFAAVPGGGPSTRLPGMVGRGRAFEILLGGEGLRRGPRRAVRLRQPRRS